ncbi:hypothetical protein Tco_0626668 [Tanacetum coccineum]|uniref:Integrase, catalytic region, zinc finger, CCHC-type, peptidase aspartic, catalytic n=1 Tax=Tanacetum coccineum TaxID=301880 RepID=A0ABQ4WK81_9ASTR
MTTLAEFMILSGGDNRPPMLDKDLYDSWQSRMKLYMENKEHGRMILKSLKNGLLIWPTIEENGLPSDIYALVNHHRVAKDLWERVQLLMQVNQQTHLVEFPYIDSGLMVPVFKQGDDPIDAINKIMSFLSTVVSSRFPTTNNQQRNSSNLIQQETIHDGRVSINYFRGDQILMLLVLQEQELILQEEREEELQWFKEKVLLVKAQRNGKVLTEEELKFLADLRITEGPVTQTIITNNAAYQANDLDAYDSDCDDITTAKVALMANLSRYNSDVLSEVPHSEHTNNDMLNQSVQEMSCSKKTHLVNYLENEITNDSNIIPYSQYLLETQNTTVHDINSSAQQDAMILYVFEQLSHQVTNCNMVNKDNLIANESLSAEFERYKKWKVKELDNIVYKIGQSAQMVHMLRKPQVFYDNNLKQALGFQNSFYLKKAQQIRSTLYDGNVIAKETNVILITDSEETLMLEEESRSKMLLKQSYPVVLEKKVNIKPVNYVVLNQIFEDFGKRFVPQQELSAVRSK